VTGPLQIIGDSGAGVLDADLGRAARAALEVPRERCLARARIYSWDRCAGRFLDLLRPIDTPAGREASLEDRKGAPSARPF
jgi:glycosyltransferase involved in cell wall biosynthesis